MTPNKKTYQKICYTNIMQIFIYIIIFIVGWLIGRFLKTNQHDGRPTSVRTASPFSTQDAKEGRGVVQERIKKRKSRILDAARAKGRITNDEVEDMFCISDDTARRYLNNLEEEGKLAQQGDRGRGVYYEPTK